MEGVEAAILTRDGVQALFDGLRDGGYRVVGPTVRDRAIVYDDIETLDDGPFARYAAACGAVLARAHSQSQNLSDVVGYAGKGGKLTKAIMAWCAAYADLSHADYLEFVGSRA